VDDRPSPPSRELLGPRFIRWLVLFVLAGAGLYLGGALWSGRADIVRAFGLLGWPAMLVAASVACATYLVRFARWHLVLRWMGHRVPVGANLVVYLSGLALTASPGKLGETVRSALLVPRGVPVAHSLGAFLTDRLSDVLGVCLLGALAAGLVDARWNYAAWALVAILGASLAFRYVVLHPPVLERCVALAARWGRRPGSVALAAVVQWARLWTLGNTVFFAVLAACAYGIQALVFAWICGRLGVEMPASRALEIFVNATLLGAASMVPGGLGAMEGALVLQLVEQGASSAAAVAASIAVRLVTLWCGILVGMLALLSFEFQREHQALR
jgi:uncharacterized membrane protein YbhN (UPF0104 family)